MPKEDGLVEINRRPPITNDYSDPPVETSYSHATLEANEGDRVYMVNGIVGTVRYKGSLPGANCEKIGLELEDSFAGTTDGSYGGRKYFETGPDKAMFLDEADIVEIFKSRRAKTTYLLKDEVLLHDGKEGTVMWLGYVPNDSVPYYGLELHPSFKGNTDGRINGKRCFQTDSNRGWFCRAADIKTRMDTKSRMDALIRRPRQPEFIYAEILDYPLGFMLKSNSDAPTIYRLRDEELLKIGIREGLRLVEVNGKQVGQMPTNIVIEQIAQSQFPLQLKFIHNATWKKWLHYTKKRIRQKAKKDAWSPICCRSKA